MATLVYQKAALGGRTVTAVAASVGGDKVAPNDRGVLSVRNGSGGSINVTIKVPGNTRFGQAEPDVVVAVPAGAEKVFGPFPRALAASVDGLVEINYSAVTTVTVAAVSI